MAANKPRWGWFNRETSIGAVLQQLAQDLQPLFARQESLRRTRDERARREIERELSRAGLEQFAQLLATLCRAYFNKHASEIGGRFEVDDFINEVQIVTIARLGQFDTRTAMFSTWFANCILPRVYADMQRRINPGWGRPNPRTPEGQLARREMFNFVNRLSLDQPATPDAPPLPVALPATSEATVQEEQCIAFFVGALQQLAAGERMLLRRLYIDRQSQREIAQSLGITPAAVSVRLKKLYARLALLLGDTFEEDCADTQFCEALRRSAP